MSSLRGGALVLCAAIAVAAACGGPPRRASTGAVSSGLRTARVLARGVLAYDVAFDGGTTLASVELGTAFELVVRDVSGGGRGERRTKLGPPDWDVVDVAVTQDGRKAAVASLDGRVRIVDLATSSVEELRLDAPATAVAFSPDGRWLASGAESGVLCLRRTADLALVQCVAAHEARLAAIAFTPGGEALASAGWDGRVVVWESPSLAVLAERRSAGAANAVAFSPDAHMLAVARSAVAPRRLSGARESDAGAVVELWPWTVAPSGANGGPPETAPAGANGGPPETAPAGANGGPPAGARASEVRTLRGHDAAPVTVAWSVDGARVISGGWDRTVRLWDPSGGREVGRLTFDRVVRGVDVSADGRWIAVASFSGQDLDGASVSLVELTGP